MSVFEDIVNVIEDIPGAVVGVVTDPVGAFEDLFETAGDAVGKVVDVLTESPECMILAGSPHYWELVRNLAAARAAGVISDQQSCEERRQQIAEWYPAVNAIPGAEFCWKCACKMALSDAAAPAAVATTAATAVSKLALSADDQITGVVSAVSWGPDRLDLFVRGSDDAVWHRCSGSGGNVWYPPKDWGCLGGQIQQPPAVVSWGSGRLDILVCGSDRALWHKCWDEKAGFWYPSETDWSPLGGQIRGGPAVATWGPDTLHIVVRGLDNSAHHMSYSKAGWSVWTNLGGEITHTPRLVSWAPGRLDMVARGSDGAVWHRCLDKRYGVWSDWASLGGQITGAPSIASWLSGRLDIVARGTDGAVWHKCYTEGAGWYPSTTEWTSLGGATRGMPSIVSWGYGHLDIVARGSDGAVWHKSYTEGAGWYPSLTGWTSLGGQTSGSPTAFTWGKGRLDIVARGKSGGVWHKYYQEPKTIVISTDKKRKAEQYAKRWYPGLTQWQSLGGQIT